MGEWEAKLKQGGLESGAVPEGHVIHRLAREFNAAFIGQSPHLSSPQGRFGVEAASLDGAPFDHASAHGKHLFLHFDSPHPANTIWVHLGLIGSFRFSALDDPEGQVRLRINNDELAADLRGPQWCRLITEAEQEAALAKLGADPLREDADPSATHKKVLASKRSIGSLLMDQSLYAGVGNIYRAEVLFRQGIDPRTEGRQLKPAELAKIWDDLVELMHEGVLQGRIDTVYPQHTPEAMHRAPRKDDHGGEVYVYRRTGQPCLVCGSPIRIAELEGRNLFWCARCQRRGPSRKIKPTPATRSRKCT